MIFQEQKIKNIYNYDVEDVFGKIHIESSFQIKAETLDDIVMLLLKQDHSAQIVQGKIKHEIGMVSYVFTKYPTWEEDKEKEKCKNIPIATKKQAGKYLAINRCKIRILNWCKKCEGVFRKHKLKNYQPKS